MLGSICSTCGGHKSMFDFFCQCRYVLVTIVFVFVFWPAAVAHWIPILFVKLICFQFFFICFQFFSISRLAGGANWSKICHEIYIQWGEGFTRGIPYLTTLPYYPHNSGPIQWARGNSALRRRATPGDSVGWFRRYQCSTLFNYDWILSPCGTFLFRIIADYCRPQRELWFEFECNYFEANAER